MPCCSIHVLLGTRLSNNNNPKHKPRWNNSLFKHVPRLLFFIYDKKRILQSESYAWIIKKQFIHPTKPTLFKLNQSSFAMVSTILVLGATGNTGRLVVGELLLQKQNVKAMVRSKERFHALVEKLPNLSVIEETVLDMQDSDLDDAVRGCDAVVSCLGHNITFKGIYGQPRRLVADSVKKICKSIQRTQPSKKVKMVLMGTDAAVNPNGMDDPRSGGERLVIGCLRALMPPVKDNEEAARYLSKDVGEEHDYVEWVVVRPTDLIDGEVSEYSLTEKPVTGLFGDGEATRANVGHFINALITNDDTWKKWVYKMPVLVNNDPN